MLIVIQTVTYTGCFDQTDSVSYHCEICSHFYLGHQCTVSKVYSVNFYDYNAIINMGSTLYGFTTYIVTVPSVCLPVLFGVVKAC